MAGRYDGSIKIDSSIDSKGFDKDIAGMTDKMGDFDGALLGAGKTGKKSIGIIVSALKGMAVALGVTLTGVVLVTAAIVAAAVAAIVLLAAVATASIREFLLIEGSAQDLKNSFADLKNSFAIAFSPLVEFAIPYIQAVISWLIKLFNTVAMVVGALQGQEKVWQAVEGGTAQAAENADTLAKNTDKATKKAKGALAAFDRINVLQKKDDVKTPTIGAGAAAAGLGGAAFEKVAINPEIIKKAEDFKQKIRDIIAAIKLWFRDLWQGIKADIKAFWSVIEDLWASISEWFRDLWASISEWASLAWQDIKDVWSVIETWFRDLWASISEWASLAWQDIKDVWSVTETWFRDLWASISEWASLAWQDIKDVWSVIETWFRDLWASISDIWGKVSEWFKSHVTDPIKDAFKSSFETIESIVKGVINKVIDFMNTMIDGIVSGINTIIGAANTVSSILPGSPSIGYISATKIPYLATGAVIPPNAQFAAILGDQKSGRNLEAPENLIRQIVREESGGGGEQKITIEFSGSMAELVRMLNPEIKKDNARIGKTLISGAIA